MAGKYTALALSLVRRHGPRLLRDLNTKTTAPPRSTATGRRARRIDYSPALDGAADPGEIVWAWVVFEDDAGQGKDRPVLVVGRDGSTMLGLMLSSQAHRRGDQNWVSIGTGDWDRMRRESFVRLDRILDIPENGIRREGAIVPRAQFDRVADILRRDYNWS